MELLGHPRSWSLVERERHPFTPERIVIGPSTPDLSWNHRDNEIRQRLDELVAQEHAGHRALYEKFRANCRSGVHLCFECGQGRECSYREDYVPERHFTQAKYRNIIWLADMLAEYYRMPYLEAWARGMVSREMLGSTGIGLGAAFVHQYQCRTPGPVPVDCTPADWWLFLYPGGMEWDALDGAPVYAAFTIVFRHGAREPGALRHLCLLSALLKDNEVLPPDHTCLRLAEMGRVEVCRLLNHAVARCLTTCKGFRT
jgi:hypothetical protein